MVKQYLHIYSKITSPTFVEAVQWTGNNWNEVKEFCNGIRYMNSFRPDEQFIINTKTCDLCVVRGDWIVKNEKGKFNVVSSNTFNEYYTEIN